MLLLLCNLVFYMEISFKHSEMLHLTRQATFKRSDCHYEPAVIPGASKLLASLRYAQGVLQHCDAQAVATSNADDKHSCEVFTASS